MQHNATYETPENLPVLDTRPALAVAALGSGSTVAEASRVAGVDRSTIYRWLDQSPEFVAELNRLRQEQRDAVRNGLRDLAFDAVKAMRDLLGSETQPAIRLRAAQAVLATIGADTFEPIGPTHKDDVGEKWTTRDLIRAITAIE